MLDLVPRSDLAELSDAELAARFDLALEALESMKKRYGFMYFFYALSWGPRIAVNDPREYWYPSHVESEIRDIENELRHRIAKQRTHLS